MSNRHIAKFVCASFSFLEKKRIVFLRISRKIYPYLTPKRFRYSAYYLVIVTHYRSTQSDYLEILKMFYAQLILKVNILTRSVESADISIVYTYHPYLPGSCGRPKLIIHKKFKNGAFLGKSHGLFTPELQNLHECTLRVATFNISRFLKVVPTDNIPDRRYANYQNSKLIGFEAKLILILAEALNFTIEILVPKEKWGEIYPNGTFTGASKLVNTA